MTGRACSCGSGDARRPLYDARGIFVAYVCAACEAARRAEYRPEIFLDPLYRIGECQRTNECDIDGSCLHCGAWQGESCRLPENGA